MATFRRSRLGVDAAKVERREYRSEDIAY